MAGERDGPAGGPTRCRAAGVLAVAVLLVLAGCAGVLSGSGDGDGGAEQTPLDRDTVTETTARAVDPADLDGVEGSVVTEDCPDVVVGNLSIAPYDRTGVQVTGTWTL